MHFIMQDKGEEREGMTYHFDCDMRIFAIFSPDPLTRQSSNRLKKRPCRVSSQAVRKRIRLWP